MKVKSWIKKIEKRMKEIETVRDKLIEDISAMEDLKDVCDRAHEDLESARAALSEIV